MLISAASKLHLSPFKEIMWAFMIWVQLLDNSSQKCLAGISRYKKSASMSRDLFRILLTRFSMENSHFIVQPRYEPGYLTLSLDTTCSPLRTKVHGAEKTRFPEKRPCRDFFCFNESWCSGARDLVRSRSHWKESFHCQQLELKECYLSKAELCCNFSRLQEESFRGTQTWLAQELSLKELHCWAPRSSAGDLRR